MNLLMLISLPVQATWNLWLQLNATQVDICDANQ